MHQESVTSEIAEEDIAEPVAEEMLNEEDHFIEDEIFIEDQQPVRCYVSFKIDGVSKKACGGAGYPFSIVAASLPEGATDVREISEEEFEGGGS